MKTSILYLFTRTPLHIGAGSSVGAIDQPVQRERHTGFPIVPGSSIKGVLRDYFYKNDTSKNDLDTAFGMGDKEESFSAGLYSFAEAKLLLFPVRSAKGSFALLTSPLVLNRFARDAGLSLKVPDVSADMSCLSGSKVTFSDSQGKAAVLEEYAYDSTGEFPQDWADCLSTLIDDTVIAGAKGRFVLVSDGDLSHFAKNACSVNQHVRIDSETGTASPGALFNEEVVPSETMFYSVIAEQKNSESRTKLLDDLNQELMLQFGGKSTTGLGFCTVKIANNI